MIQPTYGTLQTLLSNRVFRIPEYQRFYSWQSKQRKDLFSDIEAVYKKGDNEHHFMATIVCHRTQKHTHVGADSFTHYDIVDGQQRITTLVILLKCIELSIEDENEKGKIHEILVKGDGDLILLQTNNANQHIFNNFIKDGRKPSNDDIQNHADRNIRSAINDCQRFIDSWKQDNNNDVISLLRIIRNNLGFVIFDTEDQRAVYSIFEVLNSRGLSVDWLDKCKSSMMEIAFDRAKNEDSAKNNLDQLKHLWGNIYRELALTSIPGHEVMRVCATLFFGAHRGKPLSSEDSLIEFKEACVKADDAIKITSSILDTSDKLVRLDAQKYLGPVSDILHARILAVSIMKAECLDDKERQRALDQWERVTFRIFGLAGKDSRHKVGDYVRLAFKIMNGASGADRYSNIMNSLRELGQDFPIEEVVIEGLDRANLYETSPKICRYILWKYEETLADLNKSTIDPKTRIQIWEQNESDSIEHIAPQNPEPGGSWEGKVIPHDENIHRIGNLILIPSPLNSEAQRQGFSQKKSIYNRVPLRMVSEVCEKEEWSLKTINEREEKLIKWAKTAWADVSV